MTRIIAVANQKGGVGKTTTTLTLGAALQELGKKVLLIDLDPQGSMTTSLGLNPDEYDVHVYHVLRRIALGDKKGPRLNDILVDVAGMHLAPSNLGLAPAEMEFVSIPARENLLRHCLKEDVKQTEYDFVLIDCPPNLGILTYNALTAAKEVVVPLQAQYLAMKGVRDLFETVNRVRQHLNSVLEISGIVITMAEMKTVHAQQIVAIVKEAFGEEYRVFESILPKSIKVCEASLEGVSVLQFASDSAISMMYRSLAAEVLNV